MARRRRQHHHPAVPTRGRQPEPGDELTGVLASSLAKRAPGYTSLGFPDPRKLPYTPSADTACQARQEGPAA